VDAIKSSQASKNINHSLAKKALPKGGDNDVEATSILAARFVENILETAKRNLERDGRLSPVLFLRMKNGRRQAWLLHPPRTAQERSEYFFRVGATLHKEGLPVEEAVTLMEAWFVEVQKAPQALSIPPSQHPRRRECIVLFGRDVGKGRSTFVLAPFSKDREGKPVWEPAPFESSDAPRGEQMAFVGLIDDLFAGYLSEGIT
jgi:hypothetical protein